MSTNIETNKNIDTDKIDTDRINAGKDSQPSQPSGSQPLKPAASAYTALVVESLNISGDTLMSQISDLIGQGNVHRIVIKNREGHTLLSVPTSLSAVESSISDILSAEATAINVISAIVPYPKLVVEKFR